MVEVVNAFDSATAQERRRIEEQYAMNLRRLAQAKTPSLQFELGSVSHRCFYINASLPFPSSARFKYLPER